MTARANMRLLPFLLVLLATLGVSVRADAHDVGLSRSEWSATGALVTGTLVFARRDVSSETASALVNDVLVRGDGVACPSRLVSAAPFENDGTKLSVEATCPSTPARLEIEAMFLASLPFGHRHLVHAGSVDAALTLGNRVFSFTPAAVPGFFTMGLEHIVTGADHLLFLLALVLVRQRLRDTLLTVTAFTVGHSISLACATLGLLLPSPRVIEPLIALSVAFVGFENLRAPDPRLRFRLTLPFGLVHGFGFASALREVAMPREAVPRALVLFNVGVEVGQLLVLLPLLPLLTWLARFPWHPRLVRVASAGIGITGLVWLALRL